jgi:hypothetical protein
MTDVQLTEQTTRDLDIDALVAAIPTQTNAGAAWIRERLTHPTSDPDELRKRQDELRAVRTRSRAETATVTAARAELAATEADVTSVASAASDKRHAEYYTQILWSADSFAARLNTASWFAEAMVFVRTVALPLMSLVLPLFVFLAPFFVYHFVLKEPLTWSKYVALLQGSLKKAMPSVLGKPRFAGQGGVLESGEQFVHIGASVVMFAAGIWNQIAAALAMRRVVADMRRRAEAVTRYTAAVVQLAEALGLPLPSIAVWPMGSLGLFGAAWNEPDRIHRLLAVGGYLDAMAAQALLKQVSFVQYAANATNTFAITDIYHPGVEKAKRVLNSVILRDVSGNNHSNVLLTGPNRGGKSTMLKALGAAVLMSQTLGIVFARRATLPVFRHIVTALSPTDTLGKMSLFEAEIEFAKEVRGRLVDGEPMFLMMDEIFHGTNAHDGVAASQIFLDDLYGAGNVVSVVSTHYMELPERYKDRVALRCMDASMDPADSDRLLYTYQLKEGVNRHSSVREILLERGLLEKRRH